MIGVIVTYYTQHFELSDLKAKKLVATDIVILILSDLCEVRTVRRATKFYVILCRIGQDSNKLVSNPKFQVGTGNKISMKIHDD